MARRTTACGARENLGGGTGEPGCRSSRTHRSSARPTRPSSRRRANSAIGIRATSVTSSWGQWTTPWADLDALWGIGTVGFWGPVTSLIGRRETDGHRGELELPERRRCDPGRGSRHRRARHRSATRCKAAARSGHAFWRRASERGVLPVAGVLGHAGQVALPDQRGKGGRQRRRAPTPTRSCGPSRCSGPAWAAVRESAARSTSTRTSPPSGRPIAAGP